MLANLEQALKLINMIASTGLLTIKDCQKLYNSGFSVIGIDGVGMVEEIKKDF
jgi:energy-converting hydrogenase Eha subunit H